MLILRYNPKKNFNPLFFIDGDHLLAVGFIEKDGFELMKAKGTLVPFQDVEKIENHFSNVDLFKDQNQHEYYQLIFQA